MIEPAKVRAIDIHTRAEEPCGSYADDGCDEFQATMAKYFRAAPGSGYSEAASRLALPPAAVVSIQRWRSTT